MDWIKLFDGDWLYDEPDDDTKPPDKDYGEDWPIYDSIDAVRSDADGNVPIRAWIREDTQTGGDSHYAVKVYPSGYARSTRVTD